MSLHSQAAGGREYLEGDDSYQMIACCCYVMMESRGKRRERQKEGEREGEKQLKNRETD